MTESNEELLKEYLSYFPPEQFGDDDTYREFVEGATNTFTKVFPNYIWTNPLVQLCHVSIHTASPVFHDGNPFQLFGSVRVVFGDIVHHLYLRDRCHPETLPVGGKISLVIPNGCAIPSSADFRVEFDLNAISPGDDDFEISKGSFSCKFENQDDFEQVKTECVHGRHGFAAVEYIAFRHAVIANLRVSFAANVTNAPSSGASGASAIYGDITANLRNSFMCKIFEKIPSEAVKVEYGADIQLSRNVVVVPAHSRLVIRANLWTGDGQEIVCRDTKLPFDWFGHPYWENLAQNGSIRVQVMWANSCMLPSPQSTLKYTSEETTQLDKPNDADFDELGQLPFFTDVRHSQCIRKESLLEPFTHSVKEVFSVLVGAIKDTASTIYGSIVVQGEQGYAALHYMIIYRGFQAIMNVRFVISKGFSPLRSRAHVWGGLVGRYSNHRYPTHYEKEYFRLKIFWVSQDSRIAVSTGDKIPLERPVFSVPDKSSLIVDVDLHVRIDGEDDGDGGGGGKFSKTEVLRGFFVEFRTDTDYTDSPVVIEGENCNILFSVQWRSSMLFTFSL